MGRTYIRLQVNIMVAGTQIFQCTPAVKSVSLPFSVLGIFIFYQDI